MKYNEKKKACVIGQDFNTLVQILTMAYKLLDSGKFAID